MFYLPGLASTLIGSAIYPSAGAIRFFWVASLLYLIVAVNDKPLSKTFPKILPIWLVGFLWSVESAFYVTCVIGAYCFVNLISDREERKATSYVFLLFPTALAIVILSVSLWYFWRLGHFPDYRAFIEPALAVQKGFTRLPVNINGSLWVPVFIFSALVVNGKNDKPKTNNINFVLFAGLWSVFSYFIARSTDNNITNILVLFIYGFFLSTINMRDDTYKRAFCSIFPLLIITMTLAFGHPASLTHIVNTFTHQNYNLSNTLPNESIDANTILTMIRPEDIPVTYIEERNTGNFIAKNDYIDTQTKNRRSLSRTIWLPFYPATLLDGMSSERKAVFMNRWLERRSIDKGWVINQKDDYKNDPALKILLAKFLITKQTEFGLLKAVLYEKKKDK